MTTVNKGFKTGDTVVVHNVGQQYTTFRKMAETLKLPDYQYNKNLSEGVTAKVVNTHYVSYPDTLYVGIHTGDGLQYIIGSKGIELVMTVNKPEVIDHAKAFSDELARRELPINTTDLQVQSLTNFAEALGYSIKPYGAGFSKKGCNNISFSKMVQLHNMALGGSNYAHLVVGITSAQLAIASRSRLVQKVSLQRKRGSGDIIVQSHYVKTNFNNELSYKISKVFESCPSLTFEQATTLVNSGIIV